MDNLLERAVMDTVIQVLEDDSRDPLVPGRALNEEAAFGIAIEMLIGQLEFSTLEKVKEKVGEIDW